jgi:prophage antirepressor-like protein
MKEIQTFNHELFGEIRTTTDEKGETFFVGKDVAKALGYSKPLNAIAMHVDEDDSLKQGLIDSKGRVQQAIFINESGLYALVLSSKLPQAKAFKRWVTSEVLPQIRMTGGYIPTHDAEGRQLSEEELLLLAEQIVGRTLRLLNAPCENCLTATEVARSWGMDVKSFNHLLNNIGIQYRHNGRWQLSEDLKGMGLAENRHFLYYSLRGQQKSRTYLVWTPKGVNFLNRRFLASDAVGPKVVQLNLFFGGDCR